MKFLQLSIKNFLTIWNAPLYLDGKGLVLIQGVNEDDTSATSNGVGKSSIPDALCWALYGITARDVTGDAVVNKTAKKDCSVAVIMQDGASIYRITRYRKHKEFKNQTVVEGATAREDDEASVWVNLSKGTEKETQEVIDGIMGCSVDVFRAAIYAGQEQMPDLPKMTDKQLKLLIEEAAGVARLEGAYMKAREKWSGAKAVADGHVANHAAILLRIADTSLKATDAGLKHADFEATRKGRHEGYLGNVATIKGEMIDIVTRVKAMNETVLRAEYDILEEQLAENAKVVACERELAVAVSRAESTMSRAQFTADASKKEALRVKGAIDNAPEEMKKPCPECGKPHTEDELGEYCKVMKENLKVRLERVKLDAGALAASQRMVEDSKKTLDDYRGKMPDVSAVSARKRELTLALSGIAGLKSDLQLLKKDHDRNVECANGALTEANPLAAIVDHLSGTMTDLQSKAEILLGQIKHDQEKSSLYESVVKVFGPAGVRAHILDSVTPMLNERTAEYLTALSDGNISAVWSTLSSTAKGELKEKFNIEVTNEKGAESFAGLSGGEKRKVRLATMLALQDLVASRATKPIELWIGDEIDDALDTAGLERLMGVLEGKARERGTVLVVSHNELRDWIDNVVTVTKKGGYSTIEGALC